MSKRALSWLKAVVALVGSVVLAAVVLPPMFSILNRPTVDQGQRPLVMVTTSGGDRDYHLRVHNIIDKDGEFRFLLSVADDEVTYGEGGNVFGVNVQVTLAAPDGTGGMTCAPTYVDSGVISSSDINAGTRRMLQADAISGRYSSTRAIASPPDQEPDSAVPAPSATPQVPDIETLLADLDVVQYTTDLFLLDDDYWYTSAATSDGATWTVECRLDAAVVWRVGDPTNPMKQPQATLLAPEFNFGPQGDVSDHQQGMDVTLSLARAEGLELVRSYPDAQAGSMDWTMTYENRWNGELGETGNFGYTNAPTFLLQNRNVAAAEQNFLLFGGVLIGLAVTLLVRGLSDLADATLLRKGE
ncbi:hypothetical protein IF188_03070 [Microbacterium sp. NEAU-LLC]|uniref:DUF3068 domain-containing protein n=1 Tax=Microbacterium helvum TaxID=2773713 RepID=A0ABR8NKH3_9MICO|nr:hypothetical protein [Microbacterium helvum]MBD3940679.1 hypothetical protein [Microbacterium helvum]